MAKALDIRLIVVGKLKDSPELSLISEYQKRLKGILSIKEIKQSSKETEGAEILSSISEKAFIIALDERGDNLSSRHFAEAIQKASLQTKIISFIIGGADGLSENVRARANLILSFGKLTWPHMLVRVMAAEQIYRALMILDNHPYHRD